MSRCSYRPFVAQNRLSCERFSINFPDSDDEDFKKPITIKRNPEPREKLLDSGIDHVLQDEKDFQSKRKYYYSDGRIIESEKRYIVGGYKIPPFKAKILFSEIKQQIPLIKPLIYIIRNYTFGRETRLEKIYDPKQEILIEPNNEDKEIYKVLLSGCDANNTSISKQYVQMLFFPYSHLIMKFPFNVDFPNTLSIPLSSGFTGNCSLMKKFEELISYYFPYPYIMQFLTPQKHLFSKEKREEIVSEGIRNGTSHWKPNELANYLSYAFDDIDKMKIIICLRESFGEFIDRKYFNEFVDTFTH
jgi:hypothetical protein